MVRMEEDRWDDGSITGVVVLHLSDGRGVLTKVKDDDGEILTCRNPLLMVRNSVTDAVMFFNYDPLVVGSTNVFFRKENIICYYEPNKKVKKYYKMKNTLRKLQGSTKFEEVAVGASRDEDEPIQEKSEPEKLDINRLRAQTKRIKEET